MLELSSYFEHIQYEGPYRPAWEVLRDLHIKHTCAIPFENLSSFTGMPVVLDVDSIMQKFIGQRRGGYCYEHNLLFQRVLQELGFTVRGLAARVSLNQAVDAITHRSHMLLLVEAEGTAFIADTGFGGLTLTAPIRFVTDIVQDTPHGPYRLLRKGEAYYGLQARTNNEWRDLYSFDLSQQYQQDFEVFNWYVSTHPTSFFVSDLVAARPAPDGRHILHNSKYSFYGLDGRSENRELDSVDDIKQMLECKFHISTSDIPRRDASLGSILRG